MSGFTRRFEGLGPKQKAVKKRSKSAPKAGRKSVGAKATGETEKAAQKRKATRGEKGARQALDTRDGREG